MTDKQIIIDGVDVSECKCLMADGFYFPQCRWQIQQSSFSSACEQHDNCYYKQLKRKEQECETYKMEAEEGIEINAELKVALKEISFENQKFCYQIEEQTKQLDQLKADTEILEKDRANLDVIIETLKAQFNQLKAKNKELKTCYKNNLKVLRHEEKVNNNLTDRCMKVEKALQEIKEISEKSCAFFPCENEIIGCEECDRLSDKEAFEQILQKCEVLDV